VPGSPDAKSGEPDGAGFKQPHQPHFFISTMKLQQSQVWKQGDQYFRIVRLERLEVDYKAMKSPNTKKGTHHHAGKKEFCRLLKNATLLTDTEIWSAPPQ
jgi:hypothetical protein